jgi:DNA mismatch endonuclease, patch repair protein
MTDIFSREKRSIVMSRIRSNGNRDTEVALLNMFKTNRITGWRRRQKVFGNPDFIFYSYHLAIFIDGCFWHVCNKHGHIPKTNRKYWKNKLENNRKRDLNVNRYLYLHGWRVVRIWEHDLRYENKCISRIKLAMIKVDLINR